MYIIYSQSAKVDKSLADEFKSNLQTPMKLIHVGIYTAIGVGAFLVVATIFILLVKRQLAKVRYIHTCADPESLVRGGPNLTTFLF